MSGEFRCLVFFSPPLWVITVVDVDIAIRLGKSPGTLFSSAMSFASCKINDKLEQNNDSVCCCGQSSGRVPIQSKRNRTISLFSLIFRALLTMKFSSPSESDSSTLLWGSGSDAGLFLPVFLVGNVMATFRMLDLRPFLAGSQFTFWNRIQLVVRRGFHSLWQSTKTLHYVSTVLVKERTMDFIWRLIAFSSNMLHVSSSDVASGTFGFPVTLLVRLTLLL